jgi:hypothetical protein
MEKRWGVKAKCVCKTTSVYTQAYTHDIQDTVFYDDSTQERIYIHVHGIRYI